MKTMVHLVLFAPNYAYHYYWLAYTNSLMTVR